MCARSDYPSPPSPPLLSFLLPHPSDTVTTLSRSVKTCVLRLSADKVCFILSERVPVGGANLWCEILQQNLFDEYRIEGKDEKNEIYLEVVMEQLSRALKSSLNATVVKLKLTKKQGACFTVEITQVAFPAYLFYPSSIPIPFHRHRKTKGGGGGGGLNGYRFPSNKLRGGRGACPLPCAPLFLCLCSGLSSSPSWSYHSLPVLSSSLLPLHSPHLPPFPRLHPLNHDTRMSLVR